MASFNILISITSYHCNGSRYLYLKYPTSASIPPVQLSATSNFRHQNLASSFPICIVSGHLFVFTCFIIIRTFRKFIIPNITASRPIFNLHILVQSPSVLRFLYLYFLSSLSQCHRLSPSSGTTVTINTLQELAGLVQSVQSSQYPPLVYTHSWRRNCSALCYGKHTVPHYSAILSNPSPKKPSSCWITTCTTTSSMVTMRCLHSPSSSSDAQRVEEALLGIFLAIRSEESSLYHDRQSSWAGEAPSCLLVARSRQRTTVRFLPSRHHLLACITVPNRICIFFAQYLVIPIPTATSTPRRASRLMTISIILYAPTRSPLHRFCLCLRSPSSWTLTTTTRILHSLQTSSPSTYNQIIGPRYECLNYILA